jgi:hypothetical protein
MLFAIGIYNGYIIRGIGYSPSLFGGDIGDNSVTYGRIRLG